MNVTDYTEPKSTLIGPIMPSRFGSYILDLLKIWFSDPRNIPVEELKSLKYVDGDTESAINTSDVFLDIAWPEDQRISGKTPAVLVNFGNVSSTSAGSVINMPNAKFPGHSEFLSMTYDVSLVVRTAAYAGTQVLAEMLYTYLRTFSRQIQQDANLSTFIVTGMTGPELSQAPGDSKDVFKASIVCKVSGTYVSTVDTTGPVFRGLTLKPNI